MAAGFWLACGGVPPSGELSSPPSQETLRLHRDAIVVDGHNDITSFILDFDYDLGMDGGDPAKRNAALYWLPILGTMLPHSPGTQLRVSTDLRRMREGGLDAQFFSVFVDPVRFDSAPRVRALSMIASLETQVKRHNDQLELARTVADVRRIVAAGRIAVLLGLEGGDAIENDLVNLREFYARGVRYMTLTWSRTHEWADSSTDKARHGGLAPFGREVVGEMNRLGVAVDVSHVSDETFWDVLEVTAAPVIASHSSMRSLVDHPRNMSDEMLRAVADNGGVVMINFAENYVDPRKAGAWRTILFALSHLGWEETPFEMLVDQFVHAVGVAGADHVGLGSDFDGVLSLPAGMKDVSDLPNLTAALLERGLSAKDTRKILGENVLRVLGEVEAVAGALAE